MDDKVLFEILEEHSAQFQAHVLDEIHRSLPMEFFPGKGLVVTGLRHI